MIKKENVKKKKIQFFIEPPNYLGKHISYAPSHWFLFPCSCVTSYYIPSEFLSNTDSISLYYVN